MDRYDDFKDFYDTPIPEDMVFSNAPGCRTRREATHYYTQHTYFAEMHPAVTGEILYQNGHPFTMGEVINRRVTLQPDGTICKSIRIGEANLDAEKSLLERIAAETSVPVPKVHRYYVSTEFEHLVIDKMPGETLEKAWPSLSQLERESIADQVVSFVGQLRQLRSTHIKTAALFSGKPFREGLRDATDLNLERIKPYLSNEPIKTYIKQKSAAMEGRLNVLTHGDLDWSNIMIVDKKVSALIDFERGGFYPPYWEWLMARMFSCTPDSWLGLLEQRLRAKDWQEMLEVERLIQALDDCSRSGLSPDEREENRARGWAEVVKILGTCVGDEPPAVTYETAAMHPLWIAPAAHSEKSE
ncbi:kinase-like domain-containing protein [Trichoderma austrokoningii]